MQVLEADPSFPQSDPLLESCKSTIGKFGTVETDSLDISVLSQEIIYSGWLTQYYRRFASNLVHVRGKCTHDAEDSVI